MADYYYTDANRQPAGPVPYEELKDMFELGRLADGALAAEVGASEWQPVASMFGQPVTGQVGYSAPPVSPTSQAGPAPDPFEPLAGWAFGLGLASWVLCLGCLSGIPGIILGHMALSKMKRTGNKNQAALVLSIIGLVASYISTIGAILYGVFMAFVMVAAAANP